MHFLSHDFSCLLTIVYQIILPTHQEISSGIDSDQVTKTALRLRYLIEECIPYEIDVGKITVPRSRVITTDVINAARLAGGDGCQACVVFCLLVNKSWFKKQALVELWDSDLHNIRATACEVIAKNLIETKDDHDYLFRDILLKRYSIIINGKQTTPANVIERTVDLHPLRVTGSSGYQKCVNYLWRGWLIQDENDPSQFVFYKKKANASYWAHINPDKMRAPIYQNATQVIFSLIYLGLYTAVINTVNLLGNIDSLEIMLYTFTLGFLCDEFSRLWKVGYCIRFFGTMFVVLKVMMSESLIFFALLTVIIIGFLQAFIGLDNANSYADSTPFILQAIINAVMQSPDFNGFDNFAPPFGVTLYYIFTFLITAVLLNILIALFNSAYVEITENANYEYLALFAKKTMQFVRAPDENVFIAPLNLIEIFFLILPFEWWLQRHIFAPLNDIVMAILYFPLLLVAAWLETLSANKVIANRIRGEEDDDNSEQWEQSN
ncbi:Calcium channel YVC1, partial [Golovinomyces cichoracearum]